MIHNQHPHTGLPSPLWSECLLCGCYLQHERDVPLGDPDWQYASDSVARCGDEIGHICEECTGELDIIPGDVVYADAYEPADVGAA